MKYVHPDVLDNGPAHIRGNAVRALLLPSFTSGMTYAQAVAAALVQAVVSSVNFTLSNQGTGRKLMFSGPIVAAASKAIAGGSPLHIAFTDGVGRILWVDEETSHSAIVIGTNYQFPALIYISNQPQ